MPRRFTRHPTPEETALWQQVAADATPLDSAPRMIPEAKVTLRECVQKNMRPIFVETAAPRQQNDMDHHTARRFKQGKMPIEGSLDLHGMTQDRAFDALTRFLENAHHAGKRMVVVVTGKGRADTPGVLRGALPGWIANTSISRFVLALTPAKQQHGGDGAYYVLLRRKRP